MQASPTPVSVVILTKDEAANIGECLDAVCAQLAPGDEVIVIDSASRDATVELAEAYRSRAPVRVHASPTSLTFGAARNLGVSLARTGTIVFVSADAVPDEGWLSSLRSAIGSADVVYGRQRHAPPVENLATVARGLRYHHFETKPDALPETFASNVNAAYRRYAFSQIRFDEDAVGAEDVAFARAARLAGLRIAYAPTAVVRHKDVTTLRGEWRKHAREGEAYAQLRGVLGVPTAHLLWAGASAGLLALAAGSGSSWALAAGLVALFAPSLRRLATPTARGYSPLRALAAASFSPAFDLAFVGAYVRRRVLA